MIDRIVYDNFVPEKFRYLPYPVLVKMNSALFGTTHFLSAGTLLGVFRENAFIQHDTDLDFGTVGNIERKPIPEFTMVLTIDEGDLQYETVYRHEPTGIIVDIQHFHELDDEHYYTGRLEGDMIRLRKEWIDKPIMHWFLHSHFPIPDKTIDYIEYWYGKDWRIPIEDFKKEWEPR